MGAIEAGKSSKILFNLRKLFKGTGVTDLAGKGKDASAALEWK